MKELIAKIENKLSTNNLVPTICFLLAAFLLGRTLAGAVEENRAQGGNVQTSQNYVRESGTQRSSISQNGLQGENRQTSAEGIGRQDYVLTAAQVYTKEEQAVLQQPHTWGLLFTENWGLGFGEAGRCPTGNSSAEELKKYDAYYVSDTAEKKIYLTFDCGYENGNTESILDALKKHDAKATFFVVGHYLESAPDLVERMVAEGHTVGNHTYHHPDMSRISDKASFQKEMDDVRSLYKELTGQEMAMYYRPPQGKYSIENLQMAKDMGYSTFFWSLAYVDWNVDKQPSHEEALAKLTKRIHPGAIVLLHNTSKTNGEILDELLTKWEEMGYSFGTLQEVVSPEAGV